MYYYLDGVGEFNVINLVLNRRRYLMLLNIAAF